MTRDYPSKLPGVKLKHFFSMMPLVWEEEHACLCYEYDWTWSYIQRGETVGEELGVVLGRALQHAEEFKRAKCGSLLKALWGWVGEVINQEHWSPESTNWYTIL